MAWLQAPLLDNPTVSQADNSHLSMMERRPWTLRLHRRLPSRFRDLLPQPLPHLPPPSFEPTDIDSPPSPPDSLTTVSSLGSVGRRILRVFSSGRNKFGLSRRYATGLPSHDPEENNLLPELSDAPQFSTQNSISPTFYPYPNRSSFLLGDWYWNGGLQKSRSSFNDLVDIIGSVEFHSEDIRDTKWDGINKILASNAQEEWLDEDAGWTKSSVTIRVPYQPRRGVPPDPGVGPQDYTVANFYH
jgi:hypothetical protein